MTSFLTLLRASDAPVVTVELRPPRAELESAEGIDAWIDTYHAISSLARQNVRVMITDSAVGAQEENNLRHLVANLGPEWRAPNVVPFLTSKHSLDFCLGYATRPCTTASHPSSCSAATSTSGGRDASSTRGSCVRHIRDAASGARAGRLGKSERASAPRQVDYLLDASAHADFYLTQIVSHHQARDVEAFLARRAAAV